MILYRNVICSGVIDVLFDQVFVLDKSVNDMLNSLVMRNKT